MEPSSVKLLVVDCETGSDMNHRPVPPVVVEPITSRPFQWMVLPIRQNLLSRVPLPRVGEVPVELQVGVKEDHAPVLMFPAAVRLPEASTVNWPVEPMAAPAVKVGLPATLPLMVGLVRVTEPLKVGVTRVLLLRVWVSVVPTTDDSDARPCTPWLAASWARLSFPSMAVHVCRTPAPVLCVVAEVPSYPRITVHERPATPVTREISSDGVP